MAIVKTKAGTYKLDFRDQSGRRLRKTFDTLDAASTYSKQSQGDISKAVSSRRWIPSSRTLPNNGTKLAHAH